MSEHKQELTFTHDHQIRFARLSGDWNPMHTNPQIARRLLFGRQVVHGVHGLIWALDRWLEHKPALKITKLKVDFQSVITVGDQVHFQILKDEPGDALLEVVKAGATATMIKVDWAAQEGDDDPYWLSSEAMDASLAERKPRHRDASNIKGDSGSVPVLFDLELAKAEFPNLSAKLPPLQIGILLASTNLVGMVSPGMRSVYDGLKLSFDAPTFNPVDLDQQALESWQAELNLPDARTKDLLGKGCCINFEVKKFRPEHSMLDLKLSGLGCKGKIVGYLRPEKRKQPSTEELKSSVEAGRFDGYRAIIIGGSRGLGELTAKLLAAGGAKVCLTYYSGKEDAERVASDIQAAGGQAQVVQFDASKPANLKTAFEGQAGTHLYYFATSQIGVAQHSKFSPEIFEKFNAVYVKGFQDTVHAFYDEETDQKAIYPSSVFVEEIPMAMGEYAASKAAGEKLGEFLSKTLKNLQVISPRLPKLPTDQTVSLFKDDLPDPVETLLKQLFV